MAAHKPIVSTPIRDVIDLYGAVVRVAEDGALFVDAVQAALDERPEGRAVRIDQERELLRRYGWDALVGEMQRLIHGHLPLRERERVSASVQWPWPASLP
jgi:hypothetical protein